MLHHMFFEKVQESVRVNLYLFQKKRRQGASADTDDLFTVMTWLSFSMLDKS